MIEKLTGRVTVEVQGGTKYEVPCTPGDALVVAMVPTDDEDIDALTVTHVARGWNVLGKATFPANGAGLAAAMEARAALLELPIRWESPEPDPKAAGYLDAYTEIRKRANTWISNYWSLAVE